MNDFNEKKNPFYIILGLILLALSFGIVKSIFKFSESLVSKNADKISKDTFGAIGLSVILFLLYIFISIQKRYTWKIPKLIYVPLSIFTSLATIILFLSLFFVPYNLILLISIITLEIIILWMMNLDWIYVELWFYRTKNKMKNNNFLKQLISVFLSLILASIFGIWYKIPNDELTVRMLNMGSEWRKDLLIQNVEAKTFLLGDYFLFNYRLAFLVFIVSIITMNILFRSSYFSKIFSK